MDSFAQFLAESVNVADEPPGMDEWWLNVIDGLTKGDDSYLLIYADWLEEQGLDYGQALRGNHFLKLRRATDTANFANHGDDMLDNSEEITHHGFVSWREAAQILFRHYGKWRGAGIFPYDADTLGESGSTIDAWGGWGPNIRVSGDDRDFAQQSETVQVWVNGMNEMPPWVKYWLNELAGSSWVTP